MESGRWRRVYVVQFIVMESVLKSLFVRDASVQDQAVPIEQKILYSFICYNLLHPYISCSVLETLCPACESIFANLLFRTANLHNNTPPIPTVPKHTNPTAPPAITPIPHSGRIPELSSSPHSSTFSILNN